MDLLHVSPQLNLYDDSGSIWTWQPQVPPAKFVHDEDTRRGLAMDSLVAGGAIISGATVRRSMFFYDVQESCGAGGHLRIVKAGFLRVAKLGLGISYFCS